MTAAKPKLLTADDLLRLDGQGVRGELIRGALHERMPAGLRHGEVVAALLALLWMHIRPGRLGRVFGSDTGVILETNPDTVREPDVAFVSAERLPLDAEVDGYCPVAPDLVVEIKSPSDSEQEVDDKATMWLIHGVRMALMINPETGTIRVRRPDRPAALLSMDDTLDVGEVLLGFSCSVREILGN
jgi:Uma2 family endonuclease